MSSPWRNTSPAGKSRPFASTRRIHRPLRHRCFLALSGRVELDVGQSSCRLATFVRDNNKALAGLRPSCELSAWRACNEKDNMARLTLFHGGVTGFEIGGFILPPCETGEDGSGWSNRFYMTTDLNCALATRRSPKTSTVAFQREDPDRPCAATFSQGM